MLYALGLILAANLSFAIPIQGNPNTDYAEYDYNALEKVRVTNTSGKITVTPADEGAKATIMIRKKKFSALCITSITRPAIEEIVAVVDQSTGEDCEADIEIKAPKEVSLDITAGSGSVNINGFEGKLNFTLGSGTLDANGHFKSVDGKSGSGTVNIKGIDGGGSVAVGSGSVNMKFLADVEGHLDVKTGSGSTTLLFPKDSKIKASLSSGSGEINNEFLDSFGASFDINGKSGSGDLRVKSY